MSITVQMTQEQYCEAMASVIICRELNRLFSEENTIDGSMKVLLTAESFREIFTQQMLKFIAEFGMPEEDDNIDEEPDAGWPPQDGGY
jgi:hypothetical protein